jgi:hypothetical protein
MHGNSLPINMQNAWGHFANKKMHGDRLPIQNIWGHFAWRQIANIQYMGTRFQYCLQIYIYTQNKNHAWHENWSTLNIIHLRHVLKHSFNC